MLNMTPSYALWHLLGSTLVNLNTGYVSLLSTTIESFTTVNGSSPSSVTLPRFLYSEMLQWVVHPTQHNIPEDSNHQPQ